MPRLSSSPLKLPVETTKSANMAEKKNVSLQWDGRNLPRTRQAFCFPFALLHNALGASAFRRLRSFWKWFCVSVFVFCFFFSAFCLREIIPAEVEDETTHNGLKAPASNYQEFLVCVCVHVWAVGGWGEVDKESASPFAARDIWYHTGCVQ